MRRAGVFAASGGITCLPNRNRARAASSMRVRLRKRMGAPLTTITSPWRSSSTSVDMLPSFFRPSSAAVRASVAAPP